MRNKNLLNLSSTNLTKNNTDILLGTKGDDVTCWYTNPTSLNNKMNEFLNCINVDKPNLIFITETWWTELSLPCIEGYSLFRRDRTNGKRGGGVAIYVSEHITSAEVLDEALINKTEQIWCTIKVDNVSILLGCIYRPNMLDDIDEINLSLKTAKELVDSKLYSGLLVCGDFNIPSLKWNSTGAMMGDNPDIHAQKFVDTLEDSFLTQFVTEPTFQSDDNIEPVNTLDLVIGDCPERISDEICHFPPLGTIKMAHHVLKWSLNVQKTKFNSDAKYLKVFKSGDYKNMNDYFSSVDWPDIFQGRNVDECYDEFLKEYHLACGMFIPLKKCKNREFKCKWFNKDIKTLSKRKNKLWFRLRAGGFRNKDLQKEYSTCKKMLKREIKNSVWNYEWNLVNISKRNPKLLYSYVKSKQNGNRGIAALKNEIGQPTTSQTEIAERLNSYFKGVFGVNEDDVMPPFEERTQEKCPIPIISEEIVFKKLAELNVNKAVGVDEVSPHILVNCARTLSKPLKIIFELSLSSGVCPYKWKQANVTPIFKKGSRLDPGNYRPVSLTSIVCKTLEKIIRDTIMSHLLVNNLINDRQHGFVNGKACVTNLLEALDFLTKCLQDKIPLDIVFIDYLKAFDLVAHKRLLFKLSKYGITGVLLDWIASFLTNRLQRVVLGEVVSSWEEVTSGVPQGSVLGPILFIIFINEISEILVSLSELYADDTKLMKEIRTPNDIQLLQEDINKIVK